ncbi:hypothetical protein HJFPF1_12670 [Paramyrothecium foliicola]|nr:hypothetical protein HJFPF1_12670 [Paramyrothecium foliicola]
MYSTPVPQDALHNQRQAILRNSGSPIKGLVELAQLTFAWRSENVRPLSRMLPVLLLAVLLTSAMVLSSGFSSMVSSGDEVILTGARCGQVDYDKVELQDYWLHIHPYYNGMVESAGDYAQRCYEKSPESSDCSRFIERKLPMSVKTDAECPFNKSMCLSDNANIYLDTGLLDSHWNLGFNTPPESRFQYRRTLHCAPLQTEGYSSRVTDARNRSFTRYQYGPIYAGERVDECNCSFAFPDSARPVSEKTLLETVQPSYMIDSRLGLYRNRTLLFEGSDFVPSDDFDRTDADLHLIGLSGIGVRSMEKSPDLWYRLTSSFNTKIVIVNQTIEQVHWEATEPMWPMGCVSQFQYCRSSLPEEDRCTQLGSFDDTVTAAKALLDGDPGDEVLWSLNILLGPTISEVIKYLGVKALTARFNLGGSGIQATMKPNQWHLDVTHWFSTVLASTQLRMLRAATGPERDETDFQRLWGGPTTADQTRLCESQKIRSTEYMSFSFFGLLFIFIFGSIIIVLSAVIEPLTTWVQRRFQLNPYSRVEWQTTPKLHLQRLAYEELGYGRWRPGAFDIPITGGDEKLGVLDMSDMRLARLTYPSGSSFVSHDEKTVNCDASLSQTQSNGAGHKAEDYKAVFTKADE